MTLLISITLQHMFYVKDTKKEQDFNLALLLP